MFKPFFLQDRCVKWHFTDGHMCFIWLITTKEGCLLSICQEPSFSPFWCTSWVGLHFSFACTTSTPGLFPWVASTEIHDTWQLLVYTSIARVSRVMLSWKRLEILEVNVCINNSGRLSLMHKFILFYVQYVVTNMLLPMLPIMTRENFKHPLVWSSCR